MINSRNIDDLRADVAQNCHTLIKMCADQGLKVLITGTVRDNEYQEYCYKIGTAQTKVPSFHSSKVGLAFDFCQNIKGKEYSDNSFFVKVAEIAKKMGFTWGGDWKSFPDKPHLQWDNYGLFTNAMVRSGKLPPKMPIYQYKGDDEDMTQEKFNQMMDNYLESRKKLLISSWAEKGLDWCYNNGIITGDETNNLQPQCFVTREQLACMLKRFNDM